MLIEESQHLAAKVRQLAASATAVPALRAITRFAVSVAVVTTPVAVNHSHVLYSVKRCRRVFTVVGPRFLRDDQGVQT